MKLEIDRNITFGDIGGIGQLKVNYLRSIGINTYADFDTLNFNEARNLPKFGIVAATAIKNYISQLKAIDELTIQTITDDDLIKIKPTALEYFAGLAIQGILAKGDISACNEVADDAVVYAQYLIRALDEAK